MKDEPIPFTTGSDAEQAEQESVHEVYEAISPHFSQTRRKPWPLVVAFLDSLPPHTIGLDLGAGNGNHLPLAAYPPDRKGKARDLSGGGKSLSLAKTGEDVKVLPADRESLERSSKEEDLEEDLRILASGSSSDDTLKRISRAKESNDTPGRFSIALDHSQSLLGIAKGQLKSGGEGVKAELGYDGWRRGVFDWAINIAAIHHLSTPERRLQAVQAVLRPLALRSKTPYSRFMLYVWAYEQGKGSKRKMGAAAEATHLASLSQPGSHPAGSGPGPSAATAMSGLDESSNPSDAAGPSKLSGPSGPCPDKVQDVLVPWVYQPPPNLTLGPTEKTTYHRYYHLFVEGELRGLLTDAAAKEGFKMVNSRPRAGGEAADRLEKGTRWLRVRGEGWESDNWWLEGEVGIV